jgi:Ser/Thr protein kinase RdoA (MazF antagonist)
MLLFEQAPPPLPAQLDQALLAQIGEKVAMLHAASDELDADLGIPALESAKFLQERVYYTSRFLSGQHSAYLRDVSDKLGLVLQKLPRQAPDFGLCHADLVLSNLRLTPAGTVTFFDLSDALKTWRAFELAVVCWSLGNRYRDVRERLWTALLQGYASIRPLPQDLPELVPIMLVLRQIGFLGGNCATLPLRLGAEPFESGFIEKEMQRLGQFVQQAGILAGVTVLGR